MQISNCPRCNMFLAHGAQFCPNCHLDLQLHISTMHAQQQRQYHTGYADVPESRQEGVYRKLLIGLVIVLMAENVLYRIAGSLYAWLGMSNELIIRPLNWLGVFVWGGLPLMVGLILPKKNAVRIPLILIGSLYALWQVGTFIRDTFLYRDPVYFNF